MLTREDQKEIKKLLLAAVLDGMAPIRSDLAAHQKEEMDFHVALNKRIEQLALQMQLVIEDKRTQGERMTLIERRMDALERAVGSASTIPPECNS